MTCSAITCALMTDLKRLLRKGGTIMFSNNKRGFRMDHGRAEQPWD